MSGVLETAAGAFAVVGATDVVVRVAREVYSFLSDIKDSPSEIRKLQEYIHETALLAETSGKCLDELNSQASASASRDSAASQLTAARKSLNRELQSLISGFKRYKGPNKTWSRVKYVLDERKIVKTLQVLERSKSSLISGLTLAAKELSASERKNTEVLIQQCFERLGQTAGQHKDALVAELQAESQKSMQNTALIKNEIHSSRQTYIRKSKLLQIEIRNSAKLSSTKHQKTQDLITQHHDSISRTLFSMADTIAQKTPQRRQKMREIHFFGERPDMIMAYLLPLREIIGPAIDQLAISDSRSKIISPGHLFTLQSEIQHLIASAAQEEAARHFASTATSFDQWTYSHYDFAKNSEEINGTSSKDSQCSENDFEIFQKNPYRNAAPPTRQQRQPLIPKETIWLFTSSGYLRIHIPSHKEPFRKGNSEYFSEYSITLFPNASTDNAVAIDIRFFTRMVTSIMKPQFYTQLNAYLTLKNSKRYAKLFAHGEVSDVAVALRNGTISPYHVFPFGDNCCMVYAAAYARVDLLEYLESQGVGLSSTRNEYSAVLGAIIGTISSCDAAAKGTLGGPTPYHRLSEYLAAHIPTPLFNSEPRKTILDPFKTNLKGKLDPLVPLFSVITENDNFIKGILLVALFVHKILTSELVNVFVSLGVEPKNMSMAGGFMLKWTMEGEYLDVVEHNLITILQVGVDVHMKGSNDMTPSEYARYVGYWSAWCRALEHNKMDIKHVLEEEGNLWLLDDAWVDTWNRKFVRKFWLDSNGEKYDEGGDEIINSEGEGSSEDEWDTTEEEDQEGSDIEGDESSHNE